MASAPSDALKRRHTRLRAALTEASIDALVVTSLPNILYLTNFSGSAAIVVIDRDRLHFLTDTRYLASVADAQTTPHACPDLAVEVITGSYDASLAACLQAMGGGRVGFEAAHLSVSRFDWLTRTLAAAGRDRPLVPTEGLIEGARVRKDLYELAMLREGARRLDEVATAVFGRVSRGRTEQAIAADIDWELRRAGFERPAFETIVASGPNSALPHARPTERTLGESDVVVLDFGGVYASYCVDITRTVAVGRASERARQVHAAVLGAQQRAIAAVAPGVSRFAIDAAAREALAQAGMGDAFGHGTGHGLGIEVHENPRVVQRRDGVDTRDEAVDTGMVFTIEPGAYFPGWGGVRIEDDVVVTEHGRDCLTRVTTELLEL